MPAVRKVRPKRASSGDARFGRWLGAGSIDSVTGAPGSVCEHRPRLMFATRRSVFAANR
jgi:hypothetical protein